MNDNWDEQSTIDMINKNAERKREAVLERKNIDLINNNFHEQQLKKEIDEMFNRKFGNEIIGKEYTEKPLEYTSYKKQKKEVKVITLSRELKNRLIKLGLITATTVGLAGMIAYGSFLNEKDAKMMNIYDDYLDYVHELQLPVNEDTYREFRENYQPEEEQALEQEIEPEVEETSGRAM